MNKETIFSPDRIYRYTLWREWQGGEGYAQFICLNPSTADEVKNDPTVTRCINYSKAWGFSGFCMTNIFAYRATLPGVMKSAHDPVGPENDRHILEVAKDAGIIVAAWGSHGTHLGRADKIKSLVKNLHYLTITNSGQPGHPLYLKKDITPMVWSGV